MANFLLPFFTLDVRAPVHARTFAVMDFLGRCELMKVVGFHTILHLD